MSGAVLGMVLAATFSRGIVWFISTQRATPLQLDLGLDWRVLVFTGVLALSPSLFSISDLRSVPRERIRALRSRAAPAAQRKAASDFRFNVRWSSRRSPSPWCLLVGALALRA